ncbi:helix-turn-helix domain-containing protein [Apilactobacillus micheneri]|uniref:helix-turn-helix transcriptional regulator n=1 Tax=Apilactobacillus micheneri TaxID=1899430 RepID=UPI00112E4C6E|nr:helix-turn-helix domain-containing protein [Apilactobacillus micheneri]TPR43193.1 helix-turn-helix domain-containing protein [Apilactobacillus micheneri]TPR47030.1 helix-turn-helix domain-containing protein [Apilactobacillus micheneri]
MNQKNKYIDLSNRRKELHYTQKILAKKLGVSTLTIKKWEKRQYNMTVDHLVAYADALKMSPLEVIYPEEVLKARFNSKYPIRSIESIEQIKNRCMRLSTKRVNDVFNYSQKQLDEQNNSLVTFEGLSKRLQHHDLRIDAEAYADDEVQLLDEIDRYTESFEGTTPKDYIGCLKIKSDDVGGYSNGQKVFVRLASNDVMYSGINVIAIKDKKAYIRNFRSTHGHFYLIPVNSKSAAKDDEELNGKESKYIWKNDGEWVVKYILNQSAF